MGVFSDIPGLIESGVPEGTRFSSEQPRIAIAKAPRIQMGSMLPGYSSLETGEAVSPNGTHTSGNGQGIE